MCWMVPKPAPPPQRLRRTLPRQRLPPQRARRRHHQPHRFRRKAGLHRPLPRHHGRPPHHLPRRPLDHRPQRRLHERPCRQQARLLPHPPRPLPRRMFRVPGLAKIRRRHRRLRRRRPLLHLRFRRLRPQRRHRQRLQKCSPPRRRDRWWSYRPAAPHRWVLLQKAAPFRLIWGRIRLPLSSAMVIGWSLSLTGPKRLIFPSLRAAPFSAAWKHAKLATLPFCKCAWLPQERSARAERAMPG